MRKLMMAAAAGAVLGAGVLATISLAGSGEIGEPRETAAPVIAKPITGVARRGAVERGRRRGPTIDFFYSRANLVPPEEGGGVVQPIRCPRGAGNPIGGGARTAQGIVVAYLSRARPDNGRTPDRTYFVGIEDVDSDNDPESGALVEVQCAKGLTVRR
jgi:hypothetical protein